MKKVYLGLLMSAALLTTSCDMDTTNFGVIGQENYIETMSDCEAFVNGMYNHMRFKSGGNYIFFPDVQMDQFVGLVDNGNRGGILSMGQLNAGDTDMANIYYNCYIQVNDANYFLPRVDALLESDQFTADEKELLNYYKGTAMFSRAYAYWYLFDKYVNYDPTKLDEKGLGLQLENEFHPSGDRSTYVGRSTIRESVEFMTSQLEEAYTLIKGYETNVSAQYCAPNSARVSSYVVAALQARVALQTQDYATAAQKAELVINSGNYELTSADSYVSMWVNDEGTELLFVPFAEPGIGGQSIGENYYRNNQKNSSDYIPTADVVLAYGEGDIRFDAFFEVYQPMEVQGENYIAYAFTKFPGNPALNTGSTNLMLNKAKPFRLSELYLIAAEAYASDGAAKNETKANSYLNALRKARIEGYTAQTYSGANLLKAVRDERGKELIGEGFRLGDLRRWGNGFTREAGWEMFAGNPDLDVLSWIMDVVTPLTNNVTYAANDYRFVWPIPTREMQVNPQLTGQQNPRY
ncbi:MAG: RagB/SusD family nutrient uptake outer membrane protein [Bacteroides sp.]|nr:RagB/SusD family nutrient uptake outer membrane protein [Bacteroides sp.]